MNVLLETQPALYLCPELAGTLMTPEEFDAIDDGEEGYSYELVHGVLVVNPQLGRAQRDHQLSSVVDWWLIGNLVAGPIDVFSKRAVLRATVDAQHAGRNQGALRGRRKAGAVRGRRRSEHPLEAGRERADALKPDREADLGHGLIGHAQQRCCPLEPPGEKVGVG